MDSYRKLEMVRDRVQGVPQCVMCEKAYVGYIPLFCEVAARQQVDAVPEQSMTIIACSWGGWGNFTTEDYNCLW